MKKTILAFAAIVTLATVGCKKENENEEQAVTKDNVAGSYKLASAKIQANGAEVDMVATGYFEACDVDDVMTLKADLSYANADAGTKCSPSNDVTNGSWSLSGNSITIEGETSTVKSLTKKQMVLTQTETSGGMTATTTITLDKQ